MRFLCASLLIFALVAGPGLPLAEAMLVEAEATDCGMGCCDKSAGQTHRDPTGCPCSVPSAGCGLGVLLTGPCPEQLPVPAPSARTWEWADYSECALARHFSPPLPPPKA